MHESGLLTGLMNQLAAIARENDADRVAAVTVRLGALSNISADHFRHHFEEAAVGTIAQGATLDIETPSDISDPHAQEIMLVSADLEYPE